LRVSTLSILIDNAASDLTKLNVEMR